MDVELLKERGAEEKREQQNMARETNSGQFKKRRAEEKSEIRQKKWIWNYLKNRE